MSVDLRADGVSTTVPAARLEELTSALPAWQREALASFYATRSLDLAWLHEGRPTSQAIAAARFVGTAADHGLEPNDYGIDWPRRLALAPRLSPEDRSRLDIAFSASIALFVSDLRAGRVDPRTVRFDVGNGRDTVDLAATLTAIADASRPHSTLQSLVPAQPGYRRLEAALGRYRVIERAVGEHHLSVERTIEPGDARADLGTLAALLEALGDLPVGAVPDEATTYSGELVEAVRRFQSRHGLDADGRIGKRTLEALNTPVSARVRQIELTLERWRWVPATITLPLVVVNIPEYMLRAYDEPGLPVVEMKVVVGKATLTPTPVTTGVLEQVDFQPYWNVPRSILVNEILPKLDEPYLAAEEMEIVDPLGAVVPLDEETRSGLREGTHRIRQRPGAKNALGPVKFAFRNVHSIYLHGTPARSLFERSRRDFSHGCIRLERPADLAEWLLRDQPEWTRERIEAAMAGTEPINVKITRAPSILIVYGTVVARPDGSVHFFDDVYGMDRKLDAALRARRVVSILSP